MLLIVFLLIYMCSFANGSSYDAHGSGYNGPPGGVASGGVSTSSREQHLYHRAVAQHSRELGVSARPDFRESQSAFPSQPPPQMFHAVETMPRERILDYLRKILTELCLQNDHLGTRVFDKPSNKVQSSLKKKGGFNLVNQEASIEAIDSLSVSQSAEEVVEKLIERLESSNLEVRNLTIIIALVYLDRIAIELKVYCTSESIIKLFGACLIVASKMHRNETSREALAEVLDIPVGALLEVESAITETVQDLAIKPTTLAEYVKPLLGAFSGNRLAAPPSSTMGATIQPPPPPPPGA